MHPKLSLDFPFVGVVHLLPLPGAPRPSPGFAVVEARAIADAHTLAEGGVDALIVENYGDAPFARGPVEPHVVAFVGAVVARIRGELPELAIGVNLLRNDARGAVGVAAASGANFVRVNVHTGAMLTDQGLIEGEAHRTLRYRNELAAGGIVVAADVLVKHATPLGPVDLGRLAADTHGRGGAEVLIVSGVATGEPANEADVHAARAAAPAARVWLGSGVTLESAARWRQVAQGAIVGTALHERGDTAAPIELGRVRAMRARLPR